MIVNSITAVTRHLRDQLKRGRLIWGLHSEVWVHHGKEGVAVWGRAKEWAHKDCCLPSFVSCRS